VSRFRRSVTLAAGVFEHVRWHGLRNAFDGNLNAINPGCTFGDRIGHGFNMSVHGMVKHEYFGHDVLLLFEFEDKLKAA